MIREKHIIGILVFMLIAPLFMAFELQQSWWQRRKAPSPPEVFETLEQNQGHKLEIEFIHGRRHNHPLMAFWIQDTTGKYIESLYVAESIAKGYFRHGDASSGRWEPGPLRRPAALPYWGHKRGVRAPDGYYIPSEGTPMPDAVTGPTPKANFLIQTRTSNKDPQVFDILMEINQSWDWNRHWHNNKFPDDPYYKTSSQPALVYQVRIDTRNPQKELEMKVAGHSHWSGSTGELFEDLSTITTALDISERIVVRILE